MGLISKFKNIFKEKKYDNLIKIFIKDNKCGKKIKIILRKSYDIQRVYEEDEEAEFMVKKVIVCDNCYNKIIIDIRFDRNYKPISKEIIGGEYITEEEFTE